MLDLQEENKILKERNELCEGMILRQQTQIETIKEDILYLKCQHLRNNVILSGIPEKEQETQHDIHNAVGQFMKDELKMKECDIRNVRYDQMYRAGRKSSNPVKNRYCCKIHSQWLQTYVHESH